jgi:hypothetical protein
VGLGVDAERDYGRNEGKRGQEEVHARENRRAYEADAKMSLRAA